VWRVPVPQVIGRITLLRGRGVEGLSAVTQHPPEAPEGAYVSSRPVRNRGITALVALCQVFLLVSTLLLPAAALAQSDPSAAPDATQQVD